MGFEEGGGLPKNMASKGGQAGRKWYVKGGLTKKNSFKFGGDSIYNSAILSARMPNNGVSKVLKIQFSPGEQASGSPLLYYTPNSNSTSPTVSLQNTARGMSTFFGLCWSVLKRLNNC